MRWIDLCGGGGDDSSSRYCYCGDLFLCIAEERTVIDKRGITSTASAVSNRRMGGIEEFQQLYRGLYPAHRHSRSVWCMIYVMFLYLYIIIHYVRPTRLLRTHTGKAMGPADQPVTAKNPNLPNPVFLVRSSPLLCYTPQGGCALGDTAIRPSVCLSQPRL